MPRFLSGTFKHEKSIQKEISHKISKTHEADKAISWLCVANCIAGFSGDKFPLKRL